jgi:hypothetical protein
MSYDLTISSLWVYQKLLVIEDGGVELVAVSVAFLIFLPYYDLILNNHLMYHTLHLQSIDSGCQTMSNADLFDTSSPPKHRTGLKRCGSAAPDSINCSLNTTSCLNRRAPILLRTPNSTMLVGVHGRRWPGAGVANEALVHPTLTSPIR